MPVPVVRNLKRTVGANIAHLRQARGLSAGELARRAGVGKATLSRIEAGAHNPTIETLHAITTALGVTLGTPLHGTPTGPVFGTGIHVELVAHFDDADSSTELYRVVVPPERPPHPAASGPGLVKAATVFTGTLVVAGEDVSRSLGPGDSACWSARAPETYAAGHAEAVTAAILLRHRR